MIAFATLGLCGLVAFEIATTLAVLGKLRVAQRHVEQTGGLPDPLLPPRGLRVGAFCVPLACGPPGELTDAALRDRTVVVGFFTTSCLLCEAVCEQIEEAPLGAPLLALVHAEPSDSPAAVARIVHRLSGIAQVAYLDEAAKRAFAFRDDSGFPTLVKLRNGQVIASGHGVAELS
jgi:thiol-disulfide isomerase/thioredoxin